jgi:hypothetical protein
MSAKTHLLVCHSERSEESTATNVMQRTNTWILRCAQNDAMAEGTP